MNKVYQKYFSNCTNLSQCDDNNNKAIKDEDDDEVF